MSAAVRSPRPLGAYRGVTAVVLLREWLQDRDVGEPIRRAERLARMLGVAQSTIYDWSNGRHLPRVDQALEIARLTLIPVSYWGLSYSEKA